jgi:RsiW-degrading membrane proteinase PrsW (M82 family)
MDTLSLISFFIAPALMVFLAVISFKMMDKASYKAYLSSYFLGILTVIPMVLALSVADNMNLIHERSIRRIILFSFFLVGFFAEFSKFLLMRFHFLPKDIVSKPAHGILYMINISLGFVTAANIYFSFFWSDLLNVHIVNFTLPFANLMFGVIMGFFLGMTKFRANFVDSYTGLGAAIFFQGLYNFCLLSKDYLLLGIVALGTLIIVVILSSKAINTDLDNVV